MRRAYVGRSDSMVKTGEGEQGFWPSYADMMSAVALILFFLMLLSYISNMITGNSLKDTEAQLDVTRQSLLQKEKDLNDLERVLSVTIKEVDDAKAELEQLSSDLADTQETLAEKEEDLQQKERDLAAQDKLLADQEAKLAEQQILIGEQEEYMRAASRELLEVRGQMETIVGLRAAILKQIVDSVGQIMGDASKARINENGNISLSDGVLFDLNSHDIKAEAYPTLDRLIDVFAQLLSDPENLQYVDSIVIAGHTDNTGTEEINQNLSTLRANAVLNYLMGHDNGKLDPYAAYFSAAGTDRLPTTTPQRVRRRTVE